MSGQEIGVYFLRQFVTEHRTPRRQGALATAKLPLKQWSRSAETPAQAPRTRRQVGPPVPDGSARQPHQHNRKGCSRLRTLVSQKEQGRHVA